MGNSNEEWGNSNTGPEQDMLDEFMLLPHPTSEFDSWLASKRLTQTDLLRFGARQYGPAVLAFAFPGAVKYRNTVTSQRWAEPGSKQDRVKVTRAGTTPARGAIVAEGETDAMRLSALCRDYDILCLPGGAQNIKPAMIEVMKRYEKLYVALDNDGAGDAGSATIMAAVSHARRLRPPDGAKDWCEWDGDSLDPEALADAKPRPPVFTVTQLLAADLGQYGENNWFAQPIAPVGGLVLIHAKKKSLKSFVLLEMARAIASGTSFADFYEFSPLKEPGRVMIVQVEIDAQSYQTRVASFVDSMRTRPIEQALFLENAMVYGLADGHRPRVNLNSPKGQADILAAIEEFKPEVVCFDPLQRIMGSANIDKPNEINEVLDFFHKLGQQGITVIACHHNNKASGKNSRDADSMSGSQRLSGDPDAICTVYDPAGNDDDEDPSTRTRNFKWELRSGFAPARSITVSAHPMNPNIPVVEFDEVASAAAPQAPVPVSHKPPSIT